MFLRQKTKKCGILEKMKRLSDANFSNIEIVPNLKRVRKLIDENPNCQNPGQLVVPGKITIKRPKLFLTDIKNSASFQPSNITSSEL